MLVPVADPRRGVEEARGEIDAAIARVLDHGRYVRGPEHDLFEREFAEYLGAGHCIGVASGTAALELALRAVSRGKAGEVVTAANAGFYATAAAQLAGLRVHYADVDPETLTLTTKTVEPALTSETCAVVVTHLYGVLADVEPLADLCRQRDIPLVEDCAQAAGARRAARVAGTFGDVAAFSFYPTKNLAALGDGGAVVTEHDDLAAGVRVLREYGWESKYRVTTAHGTNSRLDELQAAILRTRLPRLDEGNNRRRSIAARYAAATPDRAGRMVRRDGADYVAHLAVLLAEDRGAVRTRMHAAGIGTDVHYPIPDHWQPLWRGTPHADVSLPATEHAAEHVLTLPCFPELTDAEVDRVCEALHEL